MKPLHLWTNYNFPFHDLSPFLSPHFLWVKFVIMWIGSGYEHKVSQTCNFKLSFCQLLTLWTWTYYFTSLNLSHLISKMTLMTILQEWWEIRAYIYKYWYRVSIKSLFPFKTHFHTHILRWKINLLVNTKYGHLLQHWSTT